MRSALNMQQILVNVMSSLETEGPVLAVPTQKSISGNILRSNPNIKKTS